MCAQPCRWKYSLVEEKRKGEYFPIYEDENGSYILNSKDLCLIEYLDELFDAGVCSFKIEGRAKSSYYVSVVTNAYKIASNILKEKICKKLRDFEIPKWVKEELNKISHRQYFTGFLFDKPTNGQFYENGSYIREYLIVGVVCEVNGEVLFCKQKNKFYSGDIVEILNPGLKPLTITVDCMFNEKKEKIESVPNSEMMFYIKFSGSCNIKPGSIIRKKLE